MAGWRAWSRATKRSAPTVDAGAWTTRQRTTGHRVEVEVGGELLAGKAAGVDPDTGALLVDDRLRGITRAIGSGEVLRCRIVELPVPAGAMGCNG